MSDPFNPDVANASFRAGEIEAWGRGIECLLEACHAADTPEPVLRYEPSGLWVEFPFPKESATPDAGTGLDERLPVYADVAVPSGPIESVAGQPCGLG